MSVLHQIPQEANQLKVKAKQLYRRGDLNIPHLFVMEYHLQSGSN